MILNRNAKNNNREAKFTIEYSKPYSLNLLLRLIGLWMGYYISDMQEGYLELMSCKFQVNFRYIICISWIYFGYIEGKLNLRHIQGISPVYLWLLKVYLRCVSDKSLAFLISDISHVYLRAFLSLSQEYRKNILGFSPAGMASNQAVNLILSAVWKPI